MSNRFYAVSPLRLRGSSALIEASKEELRVLLLLIESGGVIDSTDELAGAAEISVARCKAALTFWEEAGAITPCGEPVVKQEFADRLVRGEIDETPATVVADSIRNESLASMIDECATLMGQACLSNTEVKNITALYTQYSLSPEYIVTLAAHLADKGSLTVRKLCDEAIRLSGKGCDKVEALDAYIKEMEESSGAEWEFRRVLGIYGRNLSVSEKKYFKKWAEEYEYSVAIITEAYDISALNTGKCDLRYMDRILTDWHEAGCRTVNECKARAEAKKAWATKWLSDNDWKVNKRTLGEWAEDDPRWLAYLEGREKARKAYDDAVAVLETVK